VLPPAEKFAHLASQVPIVLDQQNMHNRFSARKLTPVNALRLYRHLLLAS
jgi:hypothetical protein